MQGLSDKGTSFCLPEQYRSIPIRTLRCSTRRKLARFLDLEGSLVLTNHDGMEIDCVNDFCGLAELAGFESLDIRNMKRHDSPTAKFLEQWQGRPTATVGRLFDFLVQLERYDVIEDCKANILHDCQIITQPMSFEQCTGGRVLNPKRSDGSFNPKSVDDVKSQKKTLYHAFVSYTDDDSCDCAFVKTLIREFEGNHGLRLFVPGRNDLPGPAKHSVDAYLIEKRCRRVLIILSDAYNRSDACRFQMKFTHALSPDARKRKLIPIVRNKSTRIPNILRFISLLDFTKTDKLDWTWQRLRVALYSSADEQTQPEPEPESSGFSELENSLRDVSVPLWRPLCVSELESDTDSAIETSCSSEKDRKLLTYESALTDDSITFLKQRHFATSPNNVLGDSCDKSRHVEKREAETDSDDTEQTVSLMQILDLEESRIDQPGVDVCHSSPKPNESEQGFESVHFSRNKQEADFEGSAEYVVLYTRLAEPTRSHNYPV
ncbi:myeloid differentiation primary response protein MyD88-like [Dreissena polymorpha]|uniref:Myeloid differentiation primary response protein MyD88 n=1 Tax=Dreissena polymorpha TaxID=45954 RepID=A0A9D3YI43_DREPO|nr:myeloid differentiation primary response protein MyD88-like [Dreissena polymorpha]KAH3699320.1 hypothetical protein DPMN_074276 [Dreissena polymorpha]